MSDSILDLKIYGTRTSGQQMIVHELKKFLMRAEIPFVLTEEAEVSIFIERGISAVPAIQINQGQIVPFKSNGEFNQSLRKAVTTVLETRNFGSIPQVLIPTDFSDVSLNAMLYGHRLATEMEAITKVLHVYFPSSQDMSESVMVDVDFSKLREDKLNSFVEKIDMDWGSDILKASLLGKEFRVGFPNDKILQSIDENNASLVVMGTTGDSGAIKKWFGSVSTSIMNNSSAPVLLVPREASYKGVKNVLYAYQDYNIDKSSVSQLLEFCEAFQANIHFVHVKKEGDVNPGFYLNDFIEGHYDKDKITISQLETDNVAHALNDYSLRHSVDLVAMGTHHKTFFEKLFTKSTSRTMSLQTKLPLLILK